MINIILTLDYELFGDGSGDVMQHIVKPTNELLTICNKSKVPLTIMFEVIEYLKFIEYNSYLQKDLGYSPYKEIKKQLQNAYKIGHDIQMHIHPQWVNAKYENKKWVMENPNLSITSFSSTKINNILKQGKNEIEKIIHEVDKEYECIALRLTNLPWIQAPEKVVKEMKKNDIYIHSLAATDKIDNGYWYLDKKANIIEMPILAKNVINIKKFTYKRIQSALYKRKFSKNTIAMKTKGKNSNHNILKKISHFLFGKYLLKWDFCKQTSREMNNMLKYVENRNKTKELPLIMIGHSKDFFNTKELNKFFMQIKKSENNKIISLHQYYKNNYVTHCQLIKNGNKNKKNI